MDKENILQIFEIITEINETLNNIKSNPLLVTQEDLDALEFNVNLLNSFLENMRQK